MQGTLGYVRKIKEIIQVELSSFQCVILRCKWWDTFDENNVKEYNDSGFISINSRKMWHEAREPYVFPKHCWHYEKCVVLDDNLLHKDVNMIVAG